MRKRDEIMFGTSSTLSIIIIMSEGNGGVMSILKRISMEHPSVMNLLLTVMDDMNIRGEQIQIAFYRYLNGDIPEFIRHILSRNVAMVDFINIQCARTHNCIFKAVTRGATGNRQKLYHIV